MTTPAAVQAAAEAGRAAGISDGQQDPTGSTTNPYARADVEWWAWARWYVRARRVTAAARLRAAGPVRL